MCRIPYRAEDREASNWPDDGSVIPQDDLYVITWETDFGEFPTDFRNEPTTSRFVIIESPLDAQDRSNFHRREPRSTGPEENVSLDPAKNTDCADNCL